MPPRRRDYSESVTRSKQREPAVAWPPAAGWTRRGPGLRPGVHRWRRVLCPLRSRSRRPSSRGGVWAWSRRFDDGSTGIVRRTGQVTRLPARGPRACERVADAEISETSFFSRSYSSSKRARRGNAMPYRAALPSRVLSTTFSTASHRGGRFGRREAPELRAG